MNPPCFKCLDRHKECHAKCEKYSAWKSDRESKRTIINENKQQENSYYSYLGKTIKKIKKKGR